MPKGAIVNVERQADIRKHRKSDIQFLKDAPTCYPSPSRAADTISPKSGLRRESTARTFRACEFMIDSPGLNVVLQCAFARQTKMNLFRRILLSDWSDQAGRKPGATPACAIARHAGRCAADARYRRRKSGAKRAQSRRRAGNIGQLSRMNRPQKSLFLPLANRPRPNSSRTSEFAPRFRKKGARQYQPSWISATRAAAGRRFFKLRDAGRGRPGSPSRWCQARAAREAGSTLVDGSGRGP